MVLTPQTVYSYARGAGFPPSTARQMVAIAQRESSLNPDVIGTINAAAETSYGLWQINLKDAGIRRLMAANGITAANIREPANNARAAFLLWGGNDRNLDTAWYINRTGNQYGYAEKYRAFLAALPGVETLESIFSGLPVFGGGGEVVAGGGSPAPGSPAPGSSARGGVRFDELMNELQDAAGGAESVLLIAAALTAAAIASA